MHPKTRRVFQAVLYEALAVAFVGPVLGLLFLQPLWSALGLAVCMSLVALAWNYVFNGWFEAWEARQAVRGRSLQRRLAHGLGFEGGLLVILVPMMAWWMDTTLWVALVADLGIFGFFFVYAVAFTWTFDRIFGLPQSASPVAAAPEVAPPP
jgi:uncharacterized membrane protein